MKKIYLLLTILLLLQLCACTTPSSVSEIQSNDYQTTATATKNGESIRQAMNQAIRFCSKQQQRAAATDVYTNYQALGLPDHYQYITTIRFTCTDENLYKGLKQ